MSIRAVTRNTCYGSADLMLWVKMFIVLQLQSEINKKHNLPAAMGDTFNETAA